MTRFGKWLRESRRSKGWTIVRLGEASNTAQAVISNLESGARNPSRSMVERLSAALDADMSQALMAAGFAPGEMVATGESLQMAAAYNNADAATRTVVSRILDPFVVKAEKAAESEHRRRVADMADQPDEEEAA